MNWSLELPPYVEKIDPPRSFYLTDFNPRVVKVLSDKLSEAICIEQSLFPIFIESMGGEISSLQAILSILQSAKERGIKIATITAGMAASAGAFVFCFGDEGLRFMGKNARLMIHGVQVSGLPDGKASEQTEMFNEFMKEEQELLQTVSSNLRGTRSKDWLKKELNKRKDNDWYLNAKEALDLGIANHITLPTFKMRLVPEFGIEI